MICIALSPLLSALQRISLFRGSVTTELSLYRGWILWIDPDTGLVDGELGTFPGYFWLSFFRIVFLGVLRKSIGNHHMSVYKDRKLYKFDIVWLCSPERRRLRAIYEQAKLENNVCWLCFTISTWKKALAGSLRKRLRKEYILSIKGQPYKTLPYKYIYASRH